MEAGGQVPSEDPRAPRLELSQSLIKRLLRLAERWAQNTLKAQPQITSTLCYPHCHEPRGLKHVTCQLRSLMTPAPLSVDWVVGIDWQEHAPGPSGAPVPAQDFWKNPLLWPTGPPPLQLREPPLKGLPGDPLWAPRAQVPFHCLSISFSLPEAAEPSCTWRP